MTRRVRLAVFGVAAAGFAALLIWGTLGIPDFGHYRGRYGQILNHAAVKERQATNTVTAIVFDYRGLDTMGEELILFAAVMGTALLLREVRDEEVEDVVDPMTSDAVRAIGIVAVPVIVLLALNLVSHGTLTPGGGFQGGVVAAAGLALVYLAGEWRAYHSAGPPSVVDPAEALGAGGFVAVGIVMLCAGGAFLENLLPLGTFGHLNAGGMIPVANLFVGLEVAAAFVLLFGEFVQELQAARTGKT